jgi:hypothetical protein
MIYHFTPFHVILPPPIFAAAATFFTRCRMRHRYALFFACRALSFFMLPPRYFANTPRRRYRHAAAFAPFLFAIMPRRFAAAAAILIIAATPMLISPLLMPSMPACSEQRRNATAACRHDTPPTRCRHCPIRRFRHCRFSHYHRFFFARRFY